VPLSIHQTKQKTGSLTDPLTGKKTWPASSVLAAAFDVWISTDFSENNGSVIPTREVTPPWRADSLDRGELFSADFADFAD
jgi:hypothetical protein